MGVVVPCLVVFTLTVLYCLGKNDFFSIILFLMKIFFCYISESLIFLVEKVLEAVKIQNNGFGMLF